MQLTATVMQTFKHNLNLPIKTLIRKNAKTTQCAYDNKTLNLESLMVENFKGHLYFLMYEIVMKRTTLCLFGQTNHNLLSGVLVLSESHMHMVSE